MDIELLKQLREQTLAPMQECRRALVQAQGDLVRAKDLLRKWSKTLADKKAARQTGEGIVDTYLHPNRKIGVVLELRCESDFVGKSAEFQNLAHELCLQIAAADPLSVEELLEQAWIKDESKKIGGLVSQAIAKFGENIVIQRFSRFDIR